MPRFNAFRSKSDQADDKASAHERRFACRQWSLLFARLLNRTRATCLRRAVLSPFVPAKGFLCERGFYVMKEKHERGLWCGRRPLWRGPTWRERRLGMLEDVVRRLVVPSARVYES